MDTTKKTRRKNKTDLKFLLLVCICGIASFMIGAAPATCSDTFALFADGISMYDGGFHFIYENEYAIAKGPVVFQEWGYSAILYPIASLYGWAGVAAIGGCQTLLLFLGISCACSRLKFFERRSAYACFAAGMLGTWLCFAEIGPRVFWFSGALACILFALTDSYMKKGGIAKVAMAAFLIVVESNMHASFIWVCFAAIVVAVIRSEANFKKALPLLICLPACLVNPYGIGAPMYLFSSMGKLNGLWIPEIFSAVSLQSSIGDLNREIVLGLSAILAVLSIVATVRASKYDRRTVIAIIAGIGTVIAVLMAGRNYWLPYVVFVPLSIELFSIAYPKVNDVKISLSAYKTIFACLAIGSLCFSIPKALLAQMDGVFPMGREGYYETLIDEGGTVYTDLGAAGVMEALGLQVAIDTRPETWDTAYLEGSETSLLEDFKSMADPNVATPESMIEYIKKYDFDWVVVRPGYALPVAMQKYGEEAGYVMHSDGENWQLWQKIRQ